MKLVCIVIFNLFISIIKIENILFYSLFKYLNVIMIYAPQSDIGCLKLFVFLILVLALYDRYWVQIF